MDEGIYEIFAVKYAHHDRRSSENFLLGDPHDVLQPLAYFVWVIAGRRRTFLVDTGFDEAMARKRGRTITTPVGAALTSFGFPPSAFEDIIVSHLHYDHCGNHDLFPNARYHVQDTEMAFATGRDMGHALMRVPFEVDDVVAMVRKVFAERVVFHDGTDEIAPGISLHRVGGHSKGLQCVRVMTARGAVVLASDATHLYPHFREGRVYPVTYNVGDVLAGYETLKRLADSMDHIIPGHDPAVLDLYPAATAALAGTVVRLDVAPRVQPHVGETDPAVRV